MTTPTLPGLAPETTQDTTPAAGASTPEVRPGSRAARMALPRSIDVLKDLASEHGVCGRPVSVRRTSMTTGQTEVIDLPCGAQAALIYQHKSHEPDQAIAKALDLEVEKLRRGARGGRSNTSRRREADSA